MGRFPTTSWSLVLAAGGKASAETHEALSELCQAYWRPLYEYILHRGYGDSDARDLTQEFLTRLIDKNYSSQADRERGRFRSFLLGAVNHFLASEARRGRTQKRGGGHAHISLDFEDKDGRHLPEPRDPLTPEKIFERRWALTVIDHAIASLRDVKHFEQLKQFIVEGGEPGLAYGRVAVELGMSEGAVRVAVHRLRRRFAQALRAEVGRTVESEGRVEDELRYLLAAIQE